MSQKPTAELKRFMTGLKRRNPAQEEFHQAVEEVARSVIPFLRDHPRYREAYILERLTEPDRAVSFRVVWKDDHGNIRANRGYRVQFSNAIGPYKGGLRFHRTVNLSVLKFLGFEQVFKNSLTGLPLGAAKGGANFNPKGKTDGEIMRFCHAYMEELFRHIGPDTDIPAGDIGVGLREISYMFGKYKKLRNEFTGVITGKGTAFGGSLCRTEATGFGTVYFANEVLNRVGESVEGKQCVISGAGNVAQYTAGKAIELGARVVAMSDSTGFIHDPEGITEDKLHYIIDLKTSRRGGLAEYAGKYGCDFVEGKKPWMIQCDVAFPCATQNEIEAKDAQALVRNGVRLVCEGANMPTTPEGVEVLVKGGVLFAPAKAANAGGVAVSGLEMTQNSMRLSWSHEELESRLKEIMVDIHRNCLQYGTNQDGSVDYIRGANIAGFIKVADAMLAYGVI